MAQYQPTPQASSEPPLDWPWYGIGFGAAVKRFFKKYATFEGRASRGKFWWAYLFYVIVALVLYGIVIAGVVSATVAASSTGASPKFGAGSYLAYFLLGLFFLATIVPYLAVSVRRLHDTGRSGWLIFISLIPFVGGIILLVFFASQTTPNAEQYGPPTSQLDPGSYGQPSYPPNQGYPTA